MSERATNVKYFSGDYTPSEQQRLGVSDQASLIDARGVRSFSTTHLVHDLGRRSVRGGVVTLVAQAAKFFTQTAGTALLARMLMPEDFGLVAMVSAVIGIVGVLGDLGLSAATIQRPVITHAEVSTLFWINVIVSFLLAAATAAAAPAIAWFYGEPRLVPITLVFAAMFIFGGLTAQHYALLVRQMRFVAMACVQTVPLVFCVLLAIVLALTGWGYWSIVAMFAVQGPTTAIAAWVASGWRPGRPSLCKNAGSLLAFGGNLTGFNVLTYLTRNADNILIGRFLGSDTLGIYSKAYALLLLPVQHINAPVNGVVLPALSRLQEEPERYCSFYRKAVGALAYVGMPLITFSFVDARPLVLTLLGPKWSAAITIFRLLTPAALLGTINAAPAWLLTSLGRTDRQFRWALLSTPIIICGFGVGLLWGAAGVAASFSVTFAFTFLYFVMDACRKSPVTVTDVARSVLGPLTASTLSAIAVACAHLGFSWPPVLKLLIDAAIFVVIYAPICVILPSGRELLRALPRMLRGQTTQRTFGAVTTRVAEPCVCGCSVADRNG